MDSEPINRRAPHWDLSRRELVIDGQVVKRYREPAPNQELVLAAFEEEAWPAKIFDPLPRKDGTKSKKRLRETIEALNQAHHRPKLIRFHGDGTGEGIIWNFLDDAGREM
jgi:hypothetical protein